MSSSALFLCLFCQLSIIFYRKPRASFCMDDMNLHKSGPCSWKLTAFLTIPLSVALSLTIPYTGTVISILQHFQSQVYLSKTSIYNYKVRQLFSLFPKRLDMTSLIAHSRRPSRCMFVSSVFLLLGLLKTTLKHLSAVTGVGCQSLYSKNCFLVSTLPLVFPRSKFLTSMFFRYFAFSFTIWASLAVPLEG